MTITNVSNNFIDSILPTIGTERRTKAPVWNESMKMFIINEHESAAGNRSYDGVRFTDRLVIVEHIGHYHSFTYINGIEIYAFDCRERKLIGKSQLDAYYDKELVRTTIEGMLKDYISSQLTLSNKRMSEEALNEQVKAMIDSSYCSFFDSEYMRRLENIGPLLLEAK